MHLISTPEIRSSPIFLQLCLEKSSWSAWTAHGAVQVSSSRSPAKFTNYETLQHKLRVQSQPPAKDLSQTSKHAEIGWKTMARMVKFETPGQAAWPGVSPRPSIHFMSRFFHSGLGNGNQQMLTSWLGWVSPLQSFHGSSLQTVNGWLMQQGLAVALLGSGFMCFPSSMSIWANGLPAFQMNTLQ